MSDDGMRCDRCRYWVQRAAPDEHNGDCRRYPPLIASVTVNADGEGRYLTACPGVPPDHWCGEWEAK